MAEGGTRKTIKLGDEIWEISRDEPPVEFVDLICEARQFNGIVYLSFLQTIVDAGTTPEARVNVRLRMNLAAAQSLHTLLGEMIKDALKPPDKSKAN